MKHRWIFLMLVTVLILTTVVGGCAKKEKIARFSFGEWTGDWLTIYVPKILLEEELGYRTEIKNLSVPDTWAALAVGEIDLWTTSCQPNQKALADKYIAETVDLGVSYTNVLMGWMVPKWVSEQYGITKVFHLNDPGIAQLFDVDGDGIGDLMGCTTAWKAAQINDDEIAAYYLSDLYEQKYGTETEMVAAIEGRMKKNEPVLFFFYVPHPLLARYPVGESVVWLEDPKGFWPPNHNHTHANADWVAENPNAADLLRQVKMSTDDISWSMAMIEAKGDDPAVLEQIARQWMAQNQAKVDSWLEAIK